MAKRTPIVALVGRTNVGKSSIYNAVLRRREAIVAKEAGTTRDSLMSKADWQGREFWLVDTAGLKDPEDEFEFTIQEQIYQAADNADLILVVVEANVPINDEDRKLVKLALKSQKPVVLVINKIDQAKGVDVDHVRKVGVREHVLVSATQHRGLDDLLDKIIELLPETPAKRPTETSVKLAIIGRPNVGKSYLFNALAKKQQALVSDRAGTTRDVNRTNISYHTKSIEIMDTAGMRRASKIETGVEHFSALRTIGAIEQADICLLLLDHSELDTSFDQKLAGLIKEAGKGLILVLSKWDIVPDKTAYTRDKIAADLAHSFDFVPWAPLLFVSSVTGQNVTKIFELSLEIYANRLKKIKTSELNKWLKDAVTHLPPAGVKNYMPKLNYITQETDNPTPSFKVFGSATKYIHFSYKRYLEKNFRSIFDFTGTAIQFWFLEKHATHPHGLSPTKHNQS